MSSTHDTTRTIERNSRTHSRTLALSLTLSAGQRGKTLKKTLASAASVRGKSHVSCAEYKNKLNADFTMPTKPTDQLTYILPIPMLWSNISVSRRIFRAGKAQSSSVNRLTV